MDSGKFDEIWFYNAPFFGFWESNMAGPGAFFINGDAYPDYPTKRRFAIMGFSYERGVAEMIHNLAHRTENHLKRVYGRWEANQPDPNPWEKFSAYQKANGFAGVGNCHFPPNAEKDYDYDNPNPVQSDADDWLSYPKLKGIKKTVSRETWGGPDYQRNYIKWWFSHIPKAAGKTADGRQANWWKYIYDFNSYDEHGL
ncbi:MAG: hypothetical protein BGO01_18105 [Armatimonadetes bacterium 55-13]|nr:MAG: hypothetical protein BGO01_18105 [Armatimonadetes bacterium 55-13]